MKQALGAILICMTTLLSSAQSGEQPKYEAGLITEVKPHQAPVGKPDSVVQYEVSVKVGKMLYVVLYTPPNSTDLIKYHVGMDLLVLVGDKTITFNDMLGRSMAVPILSRRLLSSEK